MRVKITYIVVFCACFICMQAQTIIPFRHVARTFAANDSVAAEAVVPTCSIAISEDSKAQVTYSIENAVENKSRVDSIDYSHLRIKGFGINTRIGYPQLPGYTDIIAVKTGNPVVRIVSSDYVEYTDYDIFPAQIPETESDTTRYPFVKDSTIYATNAFYPQNLVEVQDVQKYRGISQALVRVNPVQYNPVTRTIRCHSNIVYELDNAMTAEEMEDATPYEVVATSEDSDAGEAIYYTLPDKYIIVTVDKYKDTLTSFVQSKEQLGYKVVVLSKESWSSSDEVKSAIQAEYDRNDNSIPRFLLIVGGHGDVPAESVKYWDEVQPGSGHWLGMDLYPSDHFYSCMNGDNDYIPDMGRGRIDVNTLEELTNVIHKILVYSKSQSYSGKSIICAEFEPARTNPTMEAKRFVKTCEEIREHLISHTKCGDIERLYFAPSDINPLLYNDSIYGLGDSIPEELRRPIFAWNADNTKIQNKINTGLDLILYKGHGESYGWNNNLFSLEDLNGISNTTKYPFMFSVTCNTGMFATCNSLMPSECFATSLLKHNAGAIGVIASCWESYPGYSDVLTESMYNAMFPGLVLSSMGDNFYYSWGENYVPYSSSNLIPQYSVGEILNQGFIGLIQSFGVNTSIATGANYNMQVIQRYHLFGDPSTEIYTGESQDLNNVTISQVNGQISVNTNGLEDCRIILKPTEDEDSLEFQMVDHLTGTFTFEHSDCDYEIIIQKHNCRPVYKTLTNAHDIYLQNQVQATDKTYNGRNIYVGKNVTTETSTGDYVVKNGANLELNSTGTVTLSGGFAVEKGATLIINK